VAHAPYFTVMNHWKNILTTLIACIAMTGHLSAQEDLRTKARELDKQGNYKESLALYQEFLASGSPEPSDITSAALCLQKLNRLDEVDALIEKVVEKHAHNPSILLRASSVYFQQTHHGRIIAGEFKRGNTNSGEYVLSRSRDRIRAIQICRQALGKLPIEKTEASKEIENRYLQLSSLSHFP